jgi:thiol-disulfide isomerase/thioredoxin
MDCHKYHWIISNLHFSSNKTGSPSFKKTAKIITVFKHTVPYDEVSKIKKTAMIFFTLIFLLGPSIVHGQSSQQSFLSPEQNPVMNDEKALSAEDQFSMIKEIINFVQGNPDIPALGNGAKNVYVMITPGCPHCQTMIQHITKALKKDDYKNKYRFHFLWFYHDTNEKQLAFQGMMASGSLSDLENFINNPEKYNVDGSDHNDQNVCQEKDLLKKISHFVEDNSQCLEGFPALFCGNKSMIGCPDNFEDFMKEIAYFVATSP